MESSHFGLENDGFSLHNFAHALRIFCKFSTIKEAKKVLFGGKWAILSQKMVIFKTSKLKKKFFIMKETKTQMKVTLMFVQKTKKQTNKQTKKNKRSFEESGLIWA